MKIGISVKKQIIATTACMSLMASLLVGTAASASATTPEGEVPDTASEALEESINTLIELDAAEDAEDLEASLEEYAAENGITLEEAAAEAATEAEESYYDTGEYDGETDYALEGEYIESSENDEYFAAEDEPVMEARSGGANRNISVGTGRQKGDVVYTPATTAGANHGHSGIYHAPKTLVEAPGTGKKAKTTSSTSFKVAKKAKKQYVKTTQSNRNRAADRAYSYRGKGYNYNFAGNKNVNGKTMNCSQLVWAAYKSTSGIDLDSNGGPGVYPSNIRDSKHTVTYKSF